MQTVTATADRYQTHRWFPEFREKLSSLDPGFGPLTDDVVGYLERQEAARNGFAARREADSLDAAKRELRSRVADGHIDVADYPGELALIEQRMAAGVRKEFRYLAEMCDARAWKATADLAPAIQERLQERVAQWVDEARELIPAIGNATTADQAMARGPEVATAWSRMVPLAEKFDTAVQAMDTLRTWGCLDLIDVVDERDRLLDATGKSLDQRVVEAAFWTDQPADVIAALDDDPRPRLLVATALGTKVAVYSADEAMVHLAPVVHVDEDELKERRLRERARRLESGTGGVVPDRDPAVESLADSIMAAGSGS